MYCYLIIPLKWWFKLLANGTCAHSRSLTRTYMTEAGLDFNLDRSIIIQRSIPVLDAVVIVHFLEANCYGLHVRLRIRYRYNTALGWILITCTYATRLFRCEHPWAFKISSTHTHTHVSFIVVYLGLTVVLTTMCSLFAWRLLSTCGLGYEW